MLDSTKKIILLPDGQQTQVSTVPENWWTDSNASGYVMPTSIAPDPKNPRRVIQPLRFAELCESIKSRGVRQQLIVTPLSKSPWVEVSSAYKDCFFVAVSGHRRRSAAIETDIRAVPVRVVIYKSEKEHRMDMSLLNKGQDDLTALEEGYEIVSLKELGWKIRELCDSFGYKEPALYTRMNLTKLHPDIQKLLDPELSRGKRLSATLGGMLGQVKSPTPDELEDLFSDLSGVVTRDQITSEDLFGELEDDELRFILQKILLAVIQKRSLGSNQAMEFIRDRTLHLTAAKNAGGRPTERFQPRRRKEIISTMLGSVTTSVVVDWTPAEFRRIFEHASYEEIQAFTNRFDEATEFLSGIKKILENLKGTKQPSHPDVVRLMKLGEI